MRRRVVVVIAVACAALLAPLGAQAATVAVQQTTGFTNTVRLDFVADPGEGNRLTVSVVGETADTYDVRLLDSAASIVAGGGCSGGGGVGVAVDCTVHKALPPQIGSCVKLLCTTVPGSEWKVSMQFVLGDGGSSLDASTLPVPQPVNYRSAEIPLTVTPGLGADEIATAAGADLVKASPGDDRIRTGAGDDTFEGGPVADGADDVDLGADRNTADYGARTATVLFKDDDLANDGASGEGDRLVGVKTFEAGSGDDRLEAGGVEAPRTLDNVVFGGDGDDLIRGGPGGDVLGGQLGDDLVFGEGGEDRIGDYSSGPLALLGGDDAIDGGPGDDEIESGFGADRVNGGEGIDLLTLGAGADLGDGGPGSDQILGDEGDDVLEGGDGDDRMIGGEGRDRLSSGDGDDRVISGVLVNRIWNSLFLYSGGPIENVPDVVDCGPGSGDKAGVDGTDTVTGCEPAIRLHRLEVFDWMFQRDGPRSAQMLYLARVPGSVSLSGRGIRSARHYDRARGEELGERFFVNPVGWAKRQLNRKGHVRIRVKVVLRPDAGGQITRMHTLRLSRSKR